MVRRTPMVRLLAAMTVWEPTAEAAPPACFDSFWFACPCSWEVSAIPVYARTNLTQLSPARSQAEWEKIVMNSINIMRENLTIPRRLYFAGSTSLPAWGGAIVVQAELDDCDGNLAYTDWQVNQWDWDEIISAQVGIRDKAQLGGACQTIQWDPRQLFHTDPPYNRDPVNVLNHEFGHALGLDHPNNDCNIVPVPSSVMNSSYNRNWRHYTRYDKETPNTKYGWRNPTGHVWEHTSSNSWIQLTNWPPATGTKLTRPGSISAGGYGAFAAWPTSETHRRIGGNTLFDSWYNITNHTIPTQNPISVVYAGNDTLRAYYLQDGNYATNNKHICYRESTDHGVSWPTGACVTDTQTSEQARTTRDGVAAAFDWQTKNYVIAYNANCPASGTAPCNRIRVAVQPGPGSSLTNTKVWPEMGHHSFSPPSVACRNSASTSRCLIAFSTADLYPYLRWMEGYINSSTGAWVTTADRGQTSIPLDQSPSVVWSDFDSMFHVATHRRYRGPPDTSRLEIREKPHTAGATWGSMKSFTYTSLSTSAGSLGTIDLLGNHPLRLYLLRYLE